MPMPVRATSRIPKQHERAPVGLRGAVAVRSRVGADALGGWAPVVERADAAEVRRGGCGDRRRRWCGTAATGCIAAAARGCATAPAPAAHEPPAASVNVAARASGEGRRRTPLSSRQRARPPHPADVTLGTVGSAHADAVVRRRDARRDRGQGAALARLPRRGGEAAHPGRGDRGVRRAGQGRPRRRCVRRSRADREERAGEGAHRRWATPSRTPPRRRSSTAWTGWPRSPATASSSGRGRPAPTRLFEMNTQMAKQVLKALRRK